jgi:nitrous oxidase accessory protein NosD
MFFAVWHCIVTDIKITDRASNNTISVFVDGDGIYVYISWRSLQDDSIFENVSFGFHTVYVRDIENDFVV